MNDKVTPSHPCRAQLLGVVRRKFPFCLKCFLRHAYSARALFYIFTLVLCSCDARFDGSVLYDGAIGLKENDDIVLQEIVKQNPKIRELVHINKYDYFSIRRRIKRSEPEEVIQKQKKSYYILLILPGDFSFASNSNFRVQRESMSQGDTDFVKELLSNIIEDVSSLNDMKFSISYYCRTDAACYYVDVYKISNYSLVQITTFADT